MEVRLALVTDDASEYFDWLPPDERGYPYRIKGLPKIIGPESGEEATRMRDTCLEALKKHSE